MSKAFLYGHASLGQLLQYDAVTKKITIRQLLAKVIWDNLPDILCIQNVLRKNKNSPLSSRERAIIEVEVNQKLCVNPFI